VTFRFLHFRFHWKRKKKTIFKT